MPKLLCLPQQLMFYRLHSCSPALYVGTERQGYVLRHGYVLLIVCDSSGIAAAL